MKTAKRISILLLFAFLSTYAINDLKASEPTNLPEVVITCSSGTSGACFEYVIKWEGYSEWFCFECHWTGRMADNCSLLLIKVSNWILGNTIN